MSKQSFEFILEKYLAGTCSPSERQLVEQWYDLIGDEAKIPDSNEEWESLKTRMWIEIQKHQSARIVVLPFYRKPLYRWSIAASMLLLLSFGIYKYVSPTTTTDFVLSSTNSLETIENTTSKNKLVHLADGSSVRLFPDAKLSFPKQFEADKREVLLEGDAFFEVSKDPTKPFYVYANKLVTKVIGTSFLIKASKNQQQVQVLVQSGKVSVFRKEEIATNIAHDIEGVVILPNQQLNFDIQTENFTKTVIEQPALLTAQTFVDFSFEEIPANEVLKKIQTAYGISIIYDEELLKQCPFTADLNDEPLYNKIAILCQAIEASYETIDGQIVISSRGCQ